jgi:cell division septation protein DedD
MISNESLRSTTSRLNWESLHGKALEGGYEIGEITEADDETAAFRVRVLGDSGCRATVRFYSAPSSLAEEQLALWSRAKELRHPNLSRPLDCGLYSLDGNDLMYLVNRVPDETLDRIILDRTLEPGEAKEVLQALKPALHQMHVHGLVHGCVAPEHIFAFGDTIQLSTVTVRPINAFPPLPLYVPRYIAPESNENNTTGAADVWCLGATIFEALKRQQYTPELFEQTKVLPEQIRVFVEHSLDPSPANRPRLDAPTPLPKVPAVSRSAMPTAPPPRTGESRSERPKVQTKPLALGGVRRPTVQTVDRRGRMSPHFRRAWIYAAIGLAIIGLIIWAARPRHHQQIAAQTAAPVTAPVASWPTRTVGDARTSNAPATPNTAAPAPIANPANPPIWHVILYTFARQNDAQNRAETLNQRYPGLNIQVFSPPTRNRVYLVTAGGAMTRDEAAQVRVRALHSGLPRDTYIQNFKQ